MTATTDRDLRYLKSKKRPKALGSEAQPIRIVDLFSGCGGLTLGAIEGARRAGRNAELGLAVDLETEALRVLRETLELEEDSTQAVDLSTTLEEVGDAKSPREEELLNIASGASLLLAGPPCQGHSALNNHTRHDDDRNELYLTVARMAELVEPNAIVIENVRGVGRDTKSAMTRCKSLLEGMGYKPQEIPLDLAKLGVPQRRFRHVLVATREREFIWSEPSHDEPRTVEWAIGDLLGSTNGSVLDSASTPKAENRERIAWLFRNDKDNLPDELRPTCHRDKDHSYVSMYGRLPWKQPSQTITTGFGSMGQGRFVHSKEERTLTPHEAARLQFLPDFLRLDIVERRGQLATMIGNAAPPALTIEIVRQLVSQKFL